MAEKLREHQHGRSTVRYVERYRVSGYHPRQKKTVDVMVFVVDVFKILGYEDPSKAASNMLTRQKAANPNARVPAPCKVNGVAHTVLPAHMAVAMMQLLRREGVEDHRESLAASLQALESKIKEDYAKWHSNPDGTAKWDAPARDKRQSLFGVSGAEQEHN